MEIGILTRRAGFNHGSSLQAYAMARFLTENGYECKIINYDEYSGHPLWRIRPWVENIQWKLLNCLPINICSVKYRYLSIRASQYERFQKFEKEFLPLTSVVCRSNKELRNVAGQFKVLVCGSDQIWSPLLYDPVYYFGFLNENNRKRTVAYAPSIGTSDSSLMKPEQIKLLKSIDCISCREEAGSKIIKHIVKREVPVVLDPTLMVQPLQWDKLANSAHAIENTPYILCYFLGRHIPQNYVTKLSAVTGYKVLNIQMFNRLNDLQSHREITDIGPCEFLNLIKNAAWVCTDSFHATIFSYIFKRKMSVFERFKSTEKENQNSRIYTLLNLLKIKWALTGAEEIPDLNKQNTSYITDSAALEYWQQQSMNYIIKSINNCI